jgi:hypothetical protein
MSIGSLTNIASTYAQSLASSFLANSPAANAGTSAAASVSQASDVNQLSPFAELLSTLQQLQQSNPSQYTQLTQQIATNLSAAATATASGNATAASSLNQLAADFTSASQNNQLPNIQDLAQAVHHHHGHHVHSGSGSADATNPSNGSTNTTGSDLLSQLISSYQSNASGVNQTTDPMAIITNTLTEAGIE